MRRPPFEDEVFESDFLLFLSPERHLIFLSGTDGVQFEDQRLRVEMSRGSADMGGGGGGRDRCVIRDLSLH